ncbi:MAG: NAD-dependent epimerase/dehydratase family protein [Candidatus Brocadiia bacterium]
MRRVLITGGAGFIGSHLADALTGAGDKVIVLDNFATGHRSNLDAASATGLLEVVQGDARDASLVADSAKGCDVVYHLAARVGVRRVLESALATIEENIATSRSAADAALAAGARLVFASTSEVYGRNERVPFSEADDLTLGPPTVGRWSYAASKILDEHYLMAMHRERSLKLAVARLFNTVGPRQRAEFGMVLPRFIEAALADIKLGVYGNGSARRCFMYISDAVRALVQLGENPAADGRVFNVGTQNEVSVLDLARMVIAECNGGEIEFLPEASLGSDYADMRRRVPDTSAILDLCGWQPEHDTKSIVALTVKWRREQSKS